MTMRYTISRWNLYHKEKPSCSPCLAKKLAKPVTILRPLKGIDCNLEQNLESSFLQDYPNFEIIFCVASESDPCIPIVRKLAAKHHQISCQLIIGDENVGVNPKVNNLIRGYNLAKSDIVWILDSNVQMDHGALSRSVDLLCQPGVGLILHLPCGVRSSSFGSLMDAVFLNCTHARMFSTINRLNVASCVIGKSNLFRRSDLEDYGGLANFGQYMSEDNMIGMALMNKGYCHKVAPDLAYQSLGSSTLKDYFSRRARWTRIRKYAVAAATMYEPFTESLMAGLTAGWAFQRVLGISFWPFFIFNFVAWFVSDTFVAWVVHPRNQRGGGWTDFRMFAFAWLVRELSAIPVYIWAMSGSTVEWRGSRFYLHTDGTVEPLKHGHGPKRPIGTLPSISGPSLHKKSKFSSSTGPATVSSLGLSSSSKSSISFNTLNQSSAADPPPIDTRPRYCTQSMSLAGSMTGTLIGSAPRRSDTVDKVAALLSPTRRNVTAVSKSPSSAAGFIAPTLAII
ncbi:hypothetical protein BDEG_28133 [Batrachochytrium dendrobatidis JEL423]|uniref:Ceramide glucosyltransferase n=2 Tax=Batrachochytrium dendrobatidis TaxID=109871 RepID=A0A177WYF1_BATDL|nr:hypothetical protein BDEG_28133 [Batrachochytrium dendrobatidis JEL423]